jgi:DNA-binding protein HU-beta
MGTKAMGPQAKREIVPAMRATPLASGMDARRVKTRAAGLQRNQQPGPRATPHASAFSGENGCRQRQYRKSLIFMDPASILPASRIKGATMATQMTKSQLIEQIATKNEVAKKDVKGVIETLAEIGYKELKKNGVFLVPGFAKFVVIKKPATKARQGTNPFTGEAMTFKAKPARKIVRARPVKAAKDAV